MIKLNEAEKALKELYLGVVKESIEEKADREKNETAKIEYHEECFGDRLKQLRLHKKLKQSEVANAIGVSERVYAYFESGRLPKEETIRKIVKFFDVTIDMLFGDYRNYLKFYYDENLRTYVYCKRPCDDNMSLIKFEENGELCGYASEHYDIFGSAWEKVRKVSWSEFAHKFIKPIIAENYRMKKVIDKLTS